MVKSETYTAKQDWMLLYILQQSQRISAFFLRNWLDILPSGSIYKDPKTTKNVLRVLLRDEEHKETDGDE